MGSDAQLLKVTLPIVYFNPRSPHGERLAATMTFCASWYISIHAPRMGSDFAESDQPVNLRYFNPRSPHGERHLSQKFDSLPVLFQSTLPAWGATERDARGGSRYTISIHAPRMGSDTARIRLTGGSSYFNPRSPHGERRLCLLILENKLLYFNPRSPHGERPLMFFSVFLSD